MIMRISARFLWAIALTTGLSITSAPGFAQIQPGAATRAKLADESVLLVDRGSSLDVYLAPRVGFASSGVGRPAIKSVTRTSANAPINASQRAVVFNRDAQQYGYITGEIAFRLKASVVGTPNWFPTFTPKITRLGSLNLYVVSTASVSEFLQTMQLLSVNAEVEWVEPSVTYGGEPTVTPSLIK